MMCIHVFTTIQLFLGEQQYIFPEITDFWMSWTLSKLPFKSLGTDFYIIIFFYTFVQHRCIELVKHDSKDIYNVAKYLYLK